MDEMVTHTAHEMAVQVIEFAGGPRELALKLRQLNAPGCGFEVDLTTIVHRIQKWRLRGVSHAYAPWVAAAAGVELSEVRPGVPKS